MPTVISPPEKKRLVDGASGRAGSTCGDEARTRMAPDASSRGVGRRRLGPLLGLHASRRVGDEATAKRPSTPGRCSAAGDKPAGLSWPWSSGGDRFSAASSRSSRVRLGLVVGRVSSRTIRSPCPNSRFRTRLSSYGPMRGRLASNRTGPASRGTSGKSVQFGPDGGPLPSKTSITRGPPVVAVAVSLDPILPQR